MRTRSPERCTEPSSTASTFSALAMSLSDLPERLYCIDDVREITRSARIFARSLISRSVMPSAK